METRANYVWVGVATLVLLALVAGFAVWIARLDRGQRDTYDIYFHQSVDGLTRGAEVSYAGVPSGQVSQIEVWPQDPNYVRVRIAVDHKIPILQGTPATIQGSFTGLSTIQLSGGQRGAPPITAEGPDGEPVIPPLRSGLGELLTSAPILMDRLTKLTDRLIAVFSAPNQRAITSILANTNTFTGNLAKASPQMTRALADLDATLLQAHDTLAEFQKVGAAANKEMDPNGHSLVRQFSDTLKSAQAAADALHATLADAHPAAQALSQSTLPEAEVELRELKATTRALRDLTERLDEQGLGAVGGQKLPEYHP